ncbi:ABC transporter ATP-binding protein [Pigmentiphaga aceris]|uniref:ABC transporter ATP-binding protein n=1 Tax=Pigmentiphaga aceris TaxID=1940612 RepID=A0A5C0B0I0_9BURK|nr:ABC transporter ATP-binding protein [Pigmentiphaga aceris]QEI07384.1 ABC transporter ATP-binding protein [Pigmentiphaga aceris]
MTDVPHPANLLSAEGLVKDYGHHRVLDEVSLHVEPGSIVGLVGRNGAGKSTLIECMIGLRMPDRGQAILFGKAATSIDDTDKSRLAYVPQKPDGFDWMTIAGMLNMIASLYSNWDAQLCARLLNEWKLDGTRRLQALSPGERQQVAIIRALAPRPSLLVLDEPASALDPVARRALLREVVNLVGENETTVLFSTHLISDLERVASHVAVLHDAQLRLHASLDDVKESWRRVWWPASSALPAQPLPGEQSRRALEAGGWTLLMHDATGTLSATLPAAAQVHPVNLDDLFMEVAA